MIALTTPALSGNPGPLQFIAVPARLARSARRLVLHLPRNWPWRTAWQQLFTAARHGPPPALSY